MSTDLVTLFCPQCRRDSLGETPPCADGHDCSCPELVCIDCGHAFVVAVFDTAVVDVRAAA